jgi:hypothetical protein
VYQAQHEPGLRALLRLAELERDTSLAAWRQASGNDLTRFQAQYNTNQAIIDFITKSPIDLTERE